MDNRCFITPTRNDKFSNLRGLDLQELIVQIENFYLTYRETLGLPPDVTFGIELEYEGFLRGKINKFVNEHLTLWESNGDSSLDSGGEINSPILHDEIKYWKELQQICKYLKKEGAIMNKNAGGHIHVGAHVLGKNCDNWRKFIKTYTAYEHIIFRFIYGDNISGRRKMEEYAQPTADILFKNIPTFNSANNIMVFKWAVPSTKYYAINFGHIDFYDIQYELTDNTIEFRSPNSSSNEVIWQNNINLFTKLVLSSKSKGYDEEFIDYKLEHERVKSETEFYLYNEIHLKNALEFVDLVFDNNLDKVYFLRQYFKKFQNNYGIKQAIKAKKFTK